MECGDYQNLIALGFVGYSGVEYWIGKTEKTKANSVLEFIAMVAAILIFKIMKGNQDGK